MRDDDEVSDQNLRATRSSSIYGQTRNRKHQRDECGKGNTTVPREVTCVTGFFFGGGVDEAATARVSTVLRR